MKKIGLLLTAMLFAVMFVSAQPGGGMDPAERAKRQVEQLKTTLSLNADQVTKVEAIVKKYGEQQSKMFQEMMDGGGDREAMRGKMTKMREDQTKEIKAVLTADQSKKYDEYLKEQDARRQQGGFGGPGGGGGNR